jgi:Lrp/AsnC family leucine-responsive transcriptional regulator
MPGNSFWLKPFLKKAWGNPSGPVIFSRSWRENQEELGTEEGMKAEASEALCGLESLWARRAFLVVEGPGPGAIPGHPFSIYPLEGGRSLMKPESFAEKYTSNRPEKGNIYKWDPAICVMIDDKDLKILDSLRSNSKMTTQQISRKLMIPVTTVHNRIKKMERLGVITGYTAKVDYRKLGKDILAYVLIKVYYKGPSGKKISQEDIAREISGNPSIEEVHILAGESDIIAKVRVRSIDDLNSVIIRQLRHMEGIDKTHTMVVLSSITN